MIDKSISIEFLKILLPSIAIIISVISLVKSNRNTKRQIRIGKLEEMIESLQFFLYNYQMLYEVYARLTFYKKAPIISTQVQLEHLKMDYEEGVKFLREVIDFEKLQTKTSRLRVLANSYLPNGELKLRILSIVGMITNLVHATIHEQYEISNELYKKYPFPLDFFKYIEKIELELIKEMDLGNNGIENNKLHKYSNKFKEELNINDFS